MVFSLVILASSIVAKAIKDPISMNVFCCINLLHQLLSSTLGTAVWMCLVSGRNVLRPHPAATTSGHTHRVASRKNDKNRDFPESRNHEQKSLMNTLRVLIRLFVVT
jgi:hypothetical protein